jgi:hypothetical protein
MDSMVVECLRCGVNRLARRTPFLRFETPECPHCGYLGWAPVPVPAEIEREPKPARSEWRRLIRSVA